MRPICARSWAKLLTAWRLRCITLCIDGRVVYGHEGGRVTQGRQGDPRVTPTIYGCLALRWSVLDGRMLELFFMGIDQNQLRLLPSIDELLQSPSGLRLIAQYSRSMTLRTLRATIAQARFDILNGSLCPSPEQLLAAEEHALQQEHKPHLP